MHGFVYFVGAKAKNSPIKIGYTAGDPAARIADLQTGSPVPLFLIGVITGDPSLERWFHRQLADHRVLGEWFEASSRVLELVGRAVRAERDPKIENAALAMRVWYRPG